MTTKIKILLADDEPEVIDLLDTFTQMYFPYSQTILAKDGQEALAQINQHGDIGLIICDYNMPKMNGGKLFLQLQEQKNKAIFCLCSARSIEEMPEFSKQKPYQLIEKTQLAQGIQSLSNQLEQMQTQAPARPVDYRQIRISFLKTLGICPVDIYIALKAEKKVRIYSRDDVFTTFDYEKLQAKNVEYLYYQLSDFSTLAPYLEKTFAHLLQDTKISDEKGYLSSLTHGLDLLRLPFMTDGQVEMAQKWMEKTLTFVQKNSSKSLSEQLQSLVQEKSPWFSKHIGLCAFFAIDIANVMTLNSEQIMLKLNLAALIHDLEIDDEREEWLFSLGSLPKPTSSFKDHPQNAVDQFPKLKINTPDVDRIVKDHHELPDGTGIPRGIQGNQIGQLSAIFIIAHTLSIYCLESKDVSQIDRSTLLQKLPQSFHSISPFKEIVRAWMIS